MSHTAISLKGVSKYYKVYEKEFDRVREIIRGKPCYQTVQALEDISFSVDTGEVLGIIGRNGAGKSTLLKIVANTMQPTSGELKVSGRIAALLELGAGFHREMSGHENIYLSCAILGLSKKETDAAYDGIVEFSGIDESIHMPVRTYSSGMFVRLAFAIATHIDPEILIIDEALSVGDGAFSRKSFDRIMEFRKAGKTILLCSHSLYQVEAMCDRVLWLEDGKVKQLGDPVDLITAYGESVRMASPKRESLGDNEPEIPEPAAEEQPVAKPDKEETLPEEEQDSLPHILDVQVMVDGRDSKVHRLVSGKDDVEIRVLFDPGRDVPMPSVAVAFSGGDGRMLASAGTVNDGVVIGTNADGLGEVSILFPRLPLLRGTYNLDVGLMCERGIHIYEGILQAAEFHIEQTGMERGIVWLPHQWK